jgi:magnesium transporter
MSKQSFSTNSKKFLSESTASLVTTNVPIVSPDTKVSEVMELIAKQDWDSVSQIYVVSKIGDELLGLIPLTKLISSSASMLCEDLLQRPAVVLYEETDRERVAVEAISNNLKSIPVMDKEGRFKGAVTADKIIDVLHEEHLEDFLRSSGIRGRGSKILDFVNSNFFEILKARLPWLMVGLFIGLGASFVVSQFEETLQKYTALAFFISMVAYMSDSIGTQSETIFIRSQTILKFSFLTYVLREWVVGLLIGGILGIVAGIFAYFLFGSYQIGIILAVSLFFSMSFATVLACITPIVLKWLGKDPAVGSGPFTTAIQDVVSLLIYFSVAMTVIKYLG